MRKTMLGATGLLALAARTTANVTRLDRIFTEHYRRPNAAGTRTAGCRPPGEAQREAEAHNASLPARPGQGRVSDYMHKARQETKEGASAWHAANGRKRTPVQTAGGATKARPTATYRALRRDAAKVARRG